MKGIFGLEFIEQLATFAIFHGFSPTLRVWYYAAFVLFFFLGSTGSMSARWAAALVTVCR